MLDGRFDPDRYWQEAMVPISMEAHVKQLLEVHPAVLCNQAAAAFSCERTSCAHGTARSSGMS